MNFKITFFIAIAIAHKASAIMGVGDVVIVASDPAHELLWASEELPQWIQMIGKAEAQVQHTQEIINIAGHPKDFAQQIVNDAQPALSVTLDANSMKASTEVLDFAKASWTLYKSAPESIKGNLDVPESFQLFGNIVTRDRSLYTNMASEKALRSRLQDAISKKREVDTQELAYQQHALTSLSAASTQSEVALHQAGLSASQQRMEVAAARVTQADGELAAFMGDAQLEDHKQQVIQTEQSEKFVDAALERAERASTVSVAPSSL